MQPREGGMAAAARRTSAAAERNAGPILEVLRAHLPAAGRGRGPGGRVEVLEVASGSGQHVAAFAGALPEAHFQPSEFDAGSFQSIRAWSGEFKNVEEPLLLNAAVPTEWPVTGRRFDAVLCVNVTHISPWESTQGLMRGAGEFLGAAGKLVLYGPFTLNREFTTESNAAFDRSLKERDPRWGYRDVADVCQEAEGSALHLVEQRDMPANNFTLVFERRGGE